MSDRIRLLHVYRTYYPDPPGGIQQAIRQICQATRAHGIDSTVFCLSPQPQPGHLQQGEADVKRQRSWMAPASCDLGGPAAFQDFRRLLAQHDLVHYHFPWPFGDLLHCAARPALPTVMTYHSDIVRQPLLARLYAPLMWRVLRSMSAIIATSPVYAATSKVLSDPRIADRVQTIPLGMADLAATQPERKADHRPPPRDKPYFLFVGALRYYKGLSTLIAAAPQVRARIVVAGSGAAKKELQEQARRLGADNIEFLGPVSEAEKHDLLANCHGFVLPSNQRSEAFGMALVEAAMFAKPLISCEIGSGTSYVNVHGETGLVVQRDDPAALARAMTTLLQDTDLSRRLGEQARQRYETHFSQDALGAAHARLYQDILARRAEPKWPAPIGWSGFSLSA